MRQPVIDVKGGLLWRYRRHVEPYRVVHRNPVAYARRRVANRRAAATAAPIAYVYANPSNAGDHASYLGIRVLASRPGVELHCDPLAVSATLRALDKGPGASRRWAAVVIGGGGLLQSCFNTFWRGMLDLDLPIVVFGVGANVNERGRDLVADDVLAGLARGARALHVRDQFTARLLTAAGAPRVTVGICPSVHYVAQASREPAVAERTLLHVVHRVDLQMSGADPEQVRATVRTCASRLGIGYDEVDHMNGMDRSLLRRYARAAIVVSSRLHGCIFSFASGTPFVAVECDRKTAAFVETHASSATTIRAQDAAARISVPLLERVLASGPIRCSAATLDDSQAQMGAILDALPLVQEAPA